MRRGRLADRRKSVGLSQKAVAHAVGVKRTTVARWEQGTSTPQPWNRPALAEVLQATVEELADLLGSGSSGRSPRGDGADLMPMGGGIDPDQMECLVFAMQRPSRVDRFVVRSLATVLAEQRRAEDRIGSAPFVGPVTEQLGLVTRLVREARGPIRPAMVDVAGQWAQFLAWLNTSVGDHEAAQHWWDRAAEWSAEAGNATLTANALSFRGHLAWMRGEIGPTIGLSQAAQRDPAVFVSQRAYDAYQEARGHAMAGDTLATERKLDDARRLAQQAEEHLEERAAWSYYYSPALYTAEQGLVYLHLSFHGRAHAPKAVAALQDGIAGFEGADGSDWAAEWRYHAALAHVQNDDPDKRVVWRRPPPGQPAAPISLAS